MAVGAGGTGDDEGAGAPPGEPPSFLLPLPHWSVFVAASVAQVRGFDGVDEVEAGAVGVVEFTGGAGEEAGLLVGCCGCCCCCEVAMGFFSGEAGAEDTAVGCLEGLKGGLATEAVAPHADFAAGTGAGAGAGALAWAGTDTGAGA